MNHLVITNSGEIDTNALFLLGASTKRGDSEKIGFFGSGNKYAVATLLRKEIPFRVFSGLKEITFSVEPVEYRGESFGVIYIDGQKSSFTTSMGPTWETWFALREFICNAKDEGGYGLTVSEHDPVGSEGDTRIYVEMTEEIAAFHESLNSFIRTEEELEEVQPRSSRIKLIPKTDREELTVYRKGIRCNPETKVKSIVDYDFDQIEINESRVYNSEWIMQIDVAGALMACTSEAVIREYIKHRKDGNYVESRLDDHFSYTGSSHISSAWESVIGDTLVVSEGRAPYIPAEDAAGALILKNSLVDKLSERFPKMRIHGRDGGRFDVVTFTSDQSARVDRALDFLARMGYALNGATIEAVRFWDDDTIATYNKIKRVIYLSVDNMGDDNYLISTLFEELAHHNTDHGDGTRSFEQWIIDQVIFQGRRALKEWV